MWGEIVVSFGISRDRERIYVGFPDTDSDICLTLQHLEDDIKKLTQEELATIVRLSRKRMKQIGMNFIPPTIKEIVDKIEELSVGRKKKTRKWFPNR